MTIAGLPFVAIALAHVLMVRQPALRVRRVQVLTVLSLLFAACATDSIGDAACLCAMAASGWVFIRIVGRNKHPALVAGGIACVVAEFLMSRQLLPEVPGPPWLMVGRTIGLSYIMFRVIHLIVDVHGDEAGADLTPGRYVCFLFCYLTFLAGPIQRAEDLLAADGPNPPEGMGRFLPAIAAGYLKYTMVAAGFFAIFGWSQQAGTGLPAPVVHAAGWLAFAGYLYASFSGYSEVVRGIGGMAGLSLPANFDRPMATTNFLDFWSRWHISLSDWFKVYVFSPLVKAMIAASEQPRWVPLLGAVGYFVTFFLMGLWHGVSWRYVLYGICLGAGVSVNKLYQNALLRRLGRAGVAALGRRPWYVAGARALALTFFVVMLGFLWVPAGSIGGGTWWGWTAGAGLTGAVVFGLVVAVAAVAPRVEAVRRGWPLPAVAPGWLAAVQAAVVVIYVAIAGLPVPPLLYQFF